MRHEQLATEYGRIISCDKYELIIEEYNQPFKRELWLRHDDNPSFTLIIPKQNKKWGFEFVQTIKGKD